MKLFVSVYASQNRPKSQKKKNFKNMIVKESWKVFMQNMMQKRVLVRALLKQQTIAVCFLSNADKPEAMFRSLHIEYLYNHKLVWMFFFSGLLDKPVCI